MPNILCPKCKGKGIVFDPMSFGLTFFLPLALFIDAAMDASNGVTRQACPTCGGHGYYHIPD